MKRERVFCSGGTEMMTEDQEPIHLYNNNLYNNNEAERLAALRRYDILDTPPEAAFDRITALAARLFDMPIVLVSLVDESRGWFKSCYGFDLAEVERDATICKFALLYDDVLVIPDTRQDARLVCNPFGQSEPELRFYAGAPLMTEDGFILGTLCLLDTKPRPALTDAQTATLADLAAIVIDELELRLAARRIVQIDAVLLEVTQGVAAATGETFFYALVQHFAKVLEVDYAYIGLVADPEAEMLNTIAVCAQGEIIDNFAYSLCDTPCQEVLRQKKLCCYPRNVQTTFPNSPLLEPLKVESYIAIPVCDSYGTAIALLGIMHSKPLANVQLSESLLTIFALRIATELERQKTEEKRQQAQSALESLVEQRTIELSKTNDLLRLEITEWQQAEAALEMEREVLKALLDNVQAGIVACNAEGILTLFNRAALEFHGLPEQPLSPERWADDYDLYMPDGNTRMSKLIARGQILGAISFVTAESNRHYSKTDLALAERIAHRAAIAIDNARLYQEAQQAQQAAEQSAARLSRLQMVTAALSESLTPTQVADVIVDQGIAALGANFALVALLNETTTELEIVRTFGYEVEQLKGWHRFSVNASVPLADVVRTGQPVWAESSKERAVHYPHLSETYNQHSVGAWISIPLTVEGRAVGGISFGFSEPQLLEAEDQAFILSLAQQCAQAIARTHLYEAEQKARSQAEAANRIKDEFLAILSHELRTPLNPILGWAKLLQKGKLDPEKTKQALSTIERNAKLQSELIKDLLDVSRILQGKLSLNASPVDLTDTIRAAVETVRLAAKAKFIQVEVKLDSDVGLVSGDANRLQQVIWNLLSNAVKFSKKGGKVTLRLDQLGEQAQLTVSDTGRGIKSDFLPHVFDYFRQEDSATTRRFGGLGLGLAIVRHLVELHGGTVGAESLGEGLGATFRVRLPLMPTQPEYQNHDRPPQSCDLSNISILVVDDDTDTRDFVAFLLEQFGAKVIAVNSASKALTVLSECQPDLVLSDIGMPAMDGYTLVQQIRKLPPQQGGEIPAIALTAFAGEINHQQALAAGFQRHIAKPVEPDILVTVIASLVEEISDRPII